MDKIKLLLERIYGSEVAGTTLPRVLALLQQFPTPRTPPSIPDSFFDHTDTVLITYGDMVRQEGEPPLQTLHRFLKARLGGLIRTIHLLPFYPYSSDEGFSVIDYWRVNPALGDWADVTAFGADFRLMFDAVINHVSQHSHWFQAFKQGQAPYTGYFKTIDPHTHTDLSAVFRPRASPLLTPVETSRGVQHVWTTFSADQIDLNYESPDVLLEVLQVLLHYVARGAELIRLDAVAFLWKEAGTSSLHLPQTHAIIQLIRAVLDQVAPQVAIVTETNVPHQENISYFGDGYNEAQMVYNFSLPPLTLHAFHTGEATLLSRWAQTLSLPSRRVSFFNFLASHDGIGLMPAHGLLNQPQIDRMVQRVRALGGLISSKRNADGSYGAYELNINFLSALGDPAVAESRELKARRFLASQAIMLALRGVPGIYFHSLFGSQNWPEGVRQTGSNRSINRERLPLARLEAELADPDSLRRQVFQGYARLLRVRYNEKAFNPTGEQQVFALHPAVFAVERTYQDDTLLCLHNVSPRSLSLALPYPGWSLLDGRFLPVGECRLAPYDVLWIKRERQRGS